MIVWILIAAFMAFLLAFSIVNRIRMRIWLHALKQRSIMLANRVFDNGDRNDLFWR